MQQNNVHAQIEEALLKIPKVLEENQRLNEENYTLKIWLSVLQNAQMTTIREFLLQNRCQLASFNGLKAVIVIPELCRKKAMEMSPSIESAFKATVKHPVKVHFESNV